MVHFQVSNGNEERKGQALESIKFSDSNTEKALNSFDMTDKKSLTNEDNDIISRDQQLEEGNKENKTDDVDEGYFDLSFIESSDFLVDSAPKSNLGKVGDATCLSKIVNLVSEEMKLKLYVSDFGLEPKRRRVDASCQTIDESSRKVAVLVKDEINKIKVEKGELVENMSHLSLKCSNLNSERLSLLMQTEALQNECVKRMHDNDKLNLKIEQRDCHISTLKETLLFRDNEIDLLQKQEKSPAVLKSINEYREVEMLRVDNIRLLHDNRSLTASMDCLASQLSAMRRISKNYTDCKDDVEMMNQRLAEDNNALYLNLNAVKKELKVLNQEHQDKLREMKSLRVNLKRSASDVLASDSSSSSSSPTPFCGSFTLEDHEILLKQNSELRQSVDFLQGKVDTLHFQLKNIRSIHNAFNKALEEKSDLQKQLEEVEARNSDLWACVMSLRGSRDQDEDEEIITEVASHVIRNEEETGHVIRNEEETGHVMRLGEDTSKEENVDSLMSQRVNELEQRLNSEVERNAEMAQKIEELTGCLNDSDVTIFELQSTVEFLQEEHSIIQEDMGRKVEDIRKNKEEIVALCKAKLRDKTRKLNASRIKLGHVLLEARELKSQGKLKKDLG